DGRRTGQRLARGRRLLRLGAQGPRRLLGLSRGLVVDLLYGGGYGDLPGAVRRLPGLLLPLSRTFSQRQRGREGAARAMAGGAGRDHIGLPRQLARSPSGRRERSPDRRSGPGALWTLRSAGTSPAWGAAGGILGRARRAREAQPGAASRSRDVHGLMELLRLGQRFNFRR